MRSVFIFAKTIIRQTSFPADNKETKAAHTKNICIHNEKRSLEHINCVCHVHDTYCVYTDINTGLQ